MAKVAGVMFDTGRGPQSWTISRANCVEGTSVRGVRSPSHRGAQVLGWDPAAQEVVPGETMHLALGRWNR